MLAVMVILLVVAVALIHWRLTQVERWCAEPLDKYIRDVFAQESGGTVEPMPVIDDVWQRGVCGPRVVVRDFSADGSMVSFGPLGKSTSRRTRQTTALPVTRFRREFQVVYNAAATSPQPGDDQEAPHGQHMGT